MGKNDKLKEKLQDLALFLKKLSDPWAVPPDLEYKLHQAQHELQNLKANFKVVNDFFVDYISKTQGILNLIH